MYLIMQYADCGTIMSWDENLKSFKRSKKVYERGWEEAEFKYMEQDYSEIEKVTKFIFRQVAQGLKYLHCDMKIAHRDLKPENILYYSKAEPNEDDRVKIGDYTVAMQLNGDDKLITGEAGTLPFLAPEVFTEESFYAKPLDIWAFGVTLIVYLTEKLPFIGNSDLEIKDIIKQGIKEYPKEFSDDLKDLVQKIFAIEPSNRIKIEDILDHKWFEHNEDPGILEF